MIESVLRSPPTAHVQHKQSQSYLHDTPSYCVLRLAIQRAQQVGSASLLRQPSSRSSSLTRSLHNSHGAAYPSVELASPRRSLLCNDSITLSGYGCPLEYRTRHLRIPSSHDSRRTATISRGTEHIFERWTARKPVECTRHWFITAVEYQCICLWTSAHYIHIPPAADAIRQDTSATSRRRASGNARHGQLF